MSSFFKAPITIPAENSLKFDDIEGNSIGISANVSTNSYDLILPTSLGQVGQSIFLTEINGAQGKLQFADNYLVPMDPYYHNTTLLMHFKGYNNRVFFPLFIDDSAASIPNTASIDSNITAYVNDSPFGSGGAFQSGQFNGISDFIYFNFETPTASNLLVDNYDIITKDGTVELFFKPIITNTSGVRANIINLGCKFLDSIANTVYYYINLYQLNNTIKLDIVYGAYTDVKTITVPTTINADEWYFACITTYNANVSLYFGSVATDTTASLIGSQSLYNHPNSLNALLKNAIKLGNNLSGVSGGGFPGYITEIRSTKYINRYQGQSSVVIPIEPFPNSPTVSTLLGDTGATGMTGATGPRGYTGAGGTITYYGSFYDTTTQLAGGGLVTGVANTPAAIRINTTDSANQVSIQNNSQIKFTYGGLYNIQFSAQLDQTQGGSSFVDIWLRKNGSDLSETNTTVSISGNSNNSKVVPAWNFFVTVNDGDFIELYWATDNNNVQILAQTAQTSPYAHPAIPSIILTVNSVGYNGPTGWTGYTGATGVTGATGPSTFPNTIPAGEILFSNGASPTGSADLRFKTNPNIASNNFLQGGTGLSYINQIDKPLITSLTFNDATPAFSYAVLAQNQTDSGACAIGLTNDVSYINTTAPHIDNIHHSMSMYINSSNVTLGTLTNYLFTNNAAVIKTYDSDLLISASEGLGFLYNNGTSTYSIDDTGTLRLNATVPNDAITGGDAGLAGQALSSNGTGNSLEWISLNYYTKDTPISVINDFATVVSELPNSNVYIYNPFILLQQATNASCSTTYITVSNTSNVFISLGNTDTDVYNWDIGTASSVTKKYTVNESGITNSKNDVVAKYNSNAQIIWTSKFYSSNASLMYNYLITDNYENLYINTKTNSNLSNLCDFSIYNGIFGDPSSIVVNYNITDDWLQHIHNYDSSGAIQWVTTVSNVVAGSSTDINALEIISIGGGGGFITGNSFYQPPGGAIVNYSNASVTGTFQNVLSLDLNYFQTSGSGMGGYASLIYGGCALSKYTSAGVVQSVAVSSMNFVDLALDSTSNIVIIGRYNNGSGNYDKFCTFPVVTSTPISTINYDYSDPFPYNNYQPLIVKYNSDLTVAWNTCIGTAEYVYLNKRIIKTDSSDNIYLACAIIFSGTSQLVTFYNGTSSGPGTSTEITCRPDSAHSNDNILITKYKYNGEVQWINIIDGDKPPSPGHITCYSITTDTSGNIIVCGDFSTQYLYIYNNGSGTPAITLVNTLGSSGPDTYNRSIYIAVYNSSGSVISATLIQNPDTTVSGINNVSLNDMYYDVNNNSIWVSGQTNYIGSVAAYTGSVSGITSFKKTYTSSSTIYNFFTLEFTNLLQMDPVIVPQYSLYEPDRLLHKILINTGQDIAYITSNVDIYYNDGSNSSTFVLPPNNSIDILYDIYYGSGRWYCQSFNIEGTNYSDYLYWDSVEQRWKIGDEQIHIGANAGLTSQGLYSVAIGSNAAVTQQSFLSVAVGANAGMTQQGPYSVSIGSNAGNSAQSNGAVAIGFSAGGNSQGETAIAIGQNAGFANQSSNAIAIGISAGNIGQNQYSIAIGQNAGETNQNSGIAIGSYAGNTTQQSSAIAIGSTAGALNQGNVAIAIGDSSGIVNQGDYSVAIGASAAGNNQGLASIAIGNSSATVNQGAYSVAIGAAAGNSNQGNHSISLGELAGNNTQNDYSIAIGNEAARNWQNSNAIAIGTSAGYNYQNNNAIAIGANAGYSYLGTDCIAIGNNTSYSTTNSSNIIAIGYYSGDGINTINNSILIGNQAGNNASQATDCIVLNASGSSFYGTNSGFYTKPVRSIASSTFNYLNYDTSNGEIFVNTNSTGIIKYIGFSKNQTGSTSGVNTINIIPSSTYSSLTTGKTLIIRISITFSVSTSCDVAIRLIVDTNNVDTITTNITQTATHENRTATFSYTSTSNSHNIGVDIYTSAGTYLSTNTSDYYCIEINEA